MVTLSDLLFQLLENRHRKPPLLQIGGPAPSPLSDRGCQKNLKFSIGEHRGADITALRHQPPPLP